MTAPAFPHILPTLGDVCPACRSEILRECRSRCGGVHCDCGYFFHPDAGETPPVLIVQGGQRA